MHTAYPLWHVSSISITRSSCWLIMLTLFGVNCVLGYTAGICCLDAFLLFCSTPFTKMVTQVRSLNGLICSFWYGDAWIHTPTHHSSLEMYSQICYLIAFMFLYRTLTVSLKSKHTQRLPSFQVKVKDFSCCMSLWYYTELWKWCPIHVQTPWLYILFERECKREKWLKL